MAWRNACCIQVSPSFKQHFAVSYAQHYPQMIQESAELWSLSVQLFTIPEVAIQLVENQFLETILQLQSQLLEELTEMKGGGKVFKQVTRQLQQPLNKVLRLLFDLGYLLGHGAVCEYVLRSDAVQKAIVEVLGLWWRVAPQQRFLLQHIPFEVANQEVFLLEEHTLKAFRSLADYCRRPQASLQELRPWYEAMVRGLQSNPDFHSTFNDQSASFHMPLLRLLTSCLNFELLQDTSLAEEWRSIFPVEVLVSCLTHSARTLRLEAEIQSGRWVRNGQSMHQQQDEYRSKKFRQLDLMTIQAAMILLNMHQDEAEPLCVLWTAVFGEEEPQPKVCLRDSWQRLWMEEGKAANDEIQLRFRLFWSLLAQALNEMLPLEVALCRRSWETRYLRCPVILQRFLIQVLAAKAMSTSELMALMPKELQVREGQLVEALEAVATRKEKLYQLKSRSWAYFDCCMAECLLVRNWRELQHGAEEAALAQQAVGGLVSLGAASCPELGKEELFACQTDVELGSPSPSLPNAPSAFCTDHAKCVEIGLATGNCCPAMNGQYLSCCDATSRRLTPQRMDKKGVTIDDTTLQWCSSRIPETWPNLKAAPMGSLRIFQTWNSQWPSKGRHTSWKGLVDFVKANRLKVLVGTPVTCVEGEDEITWSWTKEFLQMVGPEHVMGLAVGNELELLYTHADSGCISEMWTGGRLWSVFQRRVAEFAT
ncbi:unnamed protein product [Effrenium voratum]|nr:unnamed protein product [Effrenium voratum]